MKVNKDIILANIEKLEKAKEMFPILLEFENGVSNEIRTQSFDSLRKECINYGLTKYLDFIDFFNKTKKRNQSVYYESKIKVKDFQNILVENSTDDFAKKSLKNKGVKSFSNLINSKRWRLLTNESRRRNRWSYTNNLESSSAIIANFVIQNEIDVDDIYRINSYYTQILPDPDNSIQFEINKTQEIINFITNSLNDSKSDFLKINYDNLMQKIGSELRSKMLEIEPGEKIKCVEIPNHPSLNIENFYNLTLNKNYNVVSKHLENGILKVVIMNDDNKSQKINFRYFDSVKEVRNTLLDQLLD